MSSVVCVACRRKFDAAPVACPACGRVQPPPGDESRGRRRMAVFAVLAAVLGAPAGYIGGYRVYAPPPSASKQQLLEKRREARVRTSAELRYALDVEKARAERDGFKPVTAEDLLLEPEKYAGKRVALQAIATRVEIRGGANDFAELGSYYASGQTLRTDLASVPEEEKRNLLALKAPQLVVARGRFQPGSLGAERIELVGTIDGASLPELLREEK